jgi:hypothetical protein
MASACECDNDTVANFTEDIPMCMNFTQILIFLSNTATLFYAEMTTCFGLKIPSSGHHGGCVWQKRKCL